MQGQQISLIELFKQPLQFIVFDPNRKYWWNRDHCHKIWENISNIDASDLVSNNWGTIIYAEHGIFEKTSVSRLVLIDGLQRLTAFSLLLAAVREQLEGIGENNLVNSGHDDEFRYKLIPAKADQKSYYDIMNGLKKEPEKLNAVYENYYYFKEEADKSGIPAEDILRAVSKIKVMNISVDQRYENAGEVYRAITEAGLDETQSDLIRNWLKIHKSASE